MSILSYRQHVKESAGVIRSQLNGSPEAAIILGTGAGGVVDHLQDRQTLAYVDIPHFPRSTAPSHQGVLHWGRWGGKTVMAFQGRFHLYEGYSLRQVTYPIRVVAALGVPRLILTNAAGGLNPLFRGGDLMVISDHINLLGDNPLVGENLEEWGPRFPDMTAVYDKEMQRVAEQAALTAGIGLRQGVYVGVRGPSLETPAETRFLRQIGADAVGMSSVAEAIVAVHAGLAILGISVISNVNLPDAMAPIAIEDVIQTVEGAGPKLVTLLEGVLEQL